MIPPLKTWYRHPLTVLLLAGVTELFTLGRLDLPSVHLWNRALADSAFVLLCITLIIGPAVRFVRQLGPLLAWRRPLGIWSTIGAGLHVAIYLQGAYDWNLFKFFAGNNHAFVVANYVGAAALLYAVILALTSNDLFQRLLRGGAWKLLQQQSYTLFALTVLHAGAFLYVLTQLGFGIFPYVYWAGLASTTGMQLAGYVRTVLRYMDHPR